MNKLLINVKQLSESTGLSVFTLYSWINQRRIPYVKVGRLVRCMEKYKRRRQGQVSNTTVNREVACLKHIFTKAIEWGIVKKNPGRKVKLLRERNTRLRYLDEKEIGRLYDTCAEHLKPIVTVALNTGMRKEEILSLRWKDVDYRIRTISILDTKNGESRELPINDIVYRTLLAVKKLPDSPWVFCKKNGERYCSSIYQHCPLLTEVGLAIESHDY